LPAFRVFVFAFNLVGAGDIILDYYHAIQAGLPVRPRSKADRPLAIGTSAA
jgi:hypothetical protein